MQTQWKKFNQWSAWLKSLNKQDRACVVEFTFALWNILDNQTKKGGTEL